MCAQAKGLSVSDRNLSLIIARKNSAPRKSEHRIQKRSEELWGSGAAPSCSQSVGPLKLICIKKIAETKATL